MDINRISHALRSNPLAWAIVYSILGGFLILGLFVADRLGSDDYKPFVPLYNAVLTAQSPTPEGGVLQLQANGCVNTSEKPIEATYLLLMTNVDKPSTVKVVAAGAGPLPAGCHEGERNVPLPLPPEITAGHWQLQLHLFLQSGTESQAISVNSNVFEVVASHDLPR